MEGEPIMPNEAQPEPEKSELQIEKEAAPENEIKKLFEENTPDSFFSKAVDFAVNDPIKFSNAYKEFFRGENFPDKEAPNGRLNALRMFAWGFINAENESDPGKKKKELIQKIKEAEEFCELMECRREEVKEKAEKIFDELKIQKHDDALSKGETEEIVEKLQSNAHNEKNIFYIILYYLQEKGEFFIPTSMAGKKQRSQLLNQRIHEIMDNPEESRRALEIVSEKLRQIVEKSNNPESIIEANKININAPSVCILEEGDLLHGGPVSSMNGKRRKGFICREILNPDYKSLSMNWVSVSFGRQRKTVDEYLEQKNYANNFIRILEKNSFLGKYRGNVAYEYGAHDEAIRSFLKTGEKRIKKTNEKELENRIWASDIKAAGDDAITYILNKQKDAFEQGANVDSSHSDEYCVAVGVPSTEIKGVIIDADREEAIRKTFVEISKFPFYIPIYDSETGVLLNKKMRKLYRE